MSELKLWKAKVVLDDNTWADALAVSDDPHAAADYINRNILDFGRKCRVKVEDLDAIPIIEGACSIWSEL